MNRDQVERMASRWRDNGETVALASGAFDLIHAGHLDYLEGLSNWADRLVVAIMPDESVSTKGANRPIIPAEQRLRMVEALRCVDAAFLFSEQGDDANLMSIKPDYFGRGDGHTENMAESETIKKLGTKIVLIHSPRITSTTEIIKRIAQ